MKRLLIMGPPGAGKGTQAANIVLRYGVNHISTGDMFRAAIKQGTPMGTLAKSFMDKGALVPDEVTVGIVRERLSLDDCKNEGFLLDGFPRNLEQAAALDQIFDELDYKLDAVINISVDDQKLIDRIIGRRICKTCGATFHVIFNKPTQDGICNECGNELITRKDDTKETAVNRLDVYNQQTQPLLKYYAKDDLVKNINGDQEVNKVFADIIAELGE